MQGLSKSDKSRVERGTGQIHTKRTMYSVLRSLKNTLTEHKRDALLELDAFIFRKWDYY